MKKYNETIDGGRSGSAQVGERNDNESADDIRRKFTQPALRFIEGRSMNAIWGVQSAGIDPLTGNEVFVRPDGSHVTEWNANDQVVIGEDRPKVHGTFGFNFEWKGFSLNTVMSYQMGGEYYNITLVNKVENVNIFHNVDKRYLYERWKNKGDVAYFKRIDDNNYTKPTSRFVMKNNQLTISSVNVGYDFRDWNFVKRLGLSSLKVMAYMNDVATFSSIKQERGTDYPFARNFNFGVSFNF